MRRLSTSRMQPAGDRVRRWIQRTGISRLVMASWIAILVAGAVGLSQPARADREHDPSEAGHPLRIVAYVLYPVGYIIDQVIFRPAHWFVSRPALAPFFGHTDDS